MANLRDSNIFQDFTVWLRDVGKIGEAPGFQPPEINIAVEEYRGGGMDGTVEIPHGIEKIEFSFDLHTWDSQIWSELGYGPGSLDVPITFRGYLLTPGGSEGSVIIETSSLIKSIKSDAVQAGKMVKQTITCVANRYRQEINGNKVIDIDVFNKVTVLGGVDKSNFARSVLGFTY
jgi:P2 family phage contractile tail tube protein